MPVDLNGNPVQVGDVVNVAFVVKEAWGDDNFCNLILEPVESMPGSGTRQVESFNSRQVTKVEPGAAAPASNVGLVTATIEGTAGTSSTVTVEPSQTVLGNAGAA